MWPSSQETADLVTFTEEILNEKLHFLCSVRFTFSVVKLCDTKMSWIEQFFERIKTTEYLKNRTIILFYGFPFYKDFSFKKRISSLIILTAV